jgi:hypothetical protein
VSVGEQEKKPVTTHPVVNPANVWSY